MMISFCFTSEPEFCFINNTPHVEGDLLEVEFQLLGCASVLCADSVQPFSQDCECIRIIINYYLVLKH